MLHVYDEVDKSLYPDDIDDQGRNFSLNNPETYNYTYDKIGNLVADKQDSIAEIVWNVQGKVQEIKRTANCSKPNLLFKYDAMGRRVSKTVIPRNVVDADTITTFYVHDAQGNVMATYENKRYNDGREELFLSEQHLYGSSRLGIRKTDLLLAKTDEDIEFDLNESYRVLGEKNFELSNHLGNVLAVVSDKRLPNNEPDIISTSDFYPFGMTLPGRSLKGTEYRYGFTGHEKEDEITQGIYSTEYRLLDTRLIIWRSVDPLFRKYPSLSSYNYVANNPMIYIDLDGRKITDEESKAKADGIKMTANVTKSLLAKELRDNPNGGNNEDIRLRIGELSKTVQDIDNMYGDETIDYKFDVTSDGKYRTELTGENQVTMFISSDQEDIDVHEARHGGQIARREYDPETNAGYGVRKEVDAYRAQYAVKGELNFQAKGENSEIFRQLGPTTNTLTKITNMNDITINMVNTIGDPEKSNINNLWYSPKLYPPDGISSEEWNNN